MPDTGEDREIRQRVNAKEAEIKSAETKMRQSTESALKVPPEGRHILQKNRKPQTRKPTQKQD